VIKAKTSELEELLTTKRRLSASHFSNQETDLFLKYYQIVLKWNDRLHLTTLTDPSAFWQHNLLESDFAASLILPTVENVWDLGSGLGVPGIPISILRPDLSIRLIESKTSKRIFLEEVTDALKLANCAVLEQRIENLAVPPVNTCLVTRAVEQISGLVPRIIDLGEECQQILFLGSKALGKIVRASVSTKKQMIENPIPNTVNRFIFNLTSST